MSEYVQWSDVVTVISSGSTDDEIPTAKCVYDNLSVIQSVLETLVTVDVADAIADLLAQLQNDRNDLADNLVTKGVVATHDETITALVPKVLDIGGGGVSITDITLNADGTYTVIDENNNTHTLAVTQTDGQITAITYDGSNVPLSFTSGLLTGVGDTDIDVSRYPEPQSSGSGTIPFSNIFDCVESKFGGNE